MPPPPPARSAAIGEFMHVCEDMMVCKVTHGVGRGAEGPTAFLPTGSRPPRA